MAEISVFFDIRPDAVDFEVFTQDGRSFAGDIVEQDMENCHYWCAENVRSIIYPFRGRHEDNWLETSAFNDARAEFGLISPDDGATFQAICLRLFERNDSETLVVPLTRVANESDNENP